VLRCEVSFLCWQRFQWHGCNPVLGVTGGLVQVWALTRLPNSDCPTAVVLNVVVHDPPCAAEAAEPVCHCHMVFVCFLLQELDEQLYEECRQRYEQEQRLRRQKEDQRQREWQQMQHRAQKQAQVKGLPNGVVNCSSTYQPILIRSKS